MRSIVDLHGFEIKGLWLVGVFGVRVYGHVSVSGLMQLFRALSPLQLPLALNPFWMFFVAFAQIVL